MVFLWWCCGGGVGFCGGVVVFLWWCGVFVVVFLCWCSCGGVVVFLWWCFCGGVFVVVFLWRCSRLSSKTAQSSAEVMAVFKDCRQTSPKVLLK